MKGQRLIVLAACAEWKMSVFLGGCFGLPYLRSIYAFPLFLSRLPQAWRDIGIRFSVRSSVRPSVRQHWRPP